MRDLTHTDPARLTLPQLIGLRYMQMRRATGMSQETFAMEVRTKYEERIPPEARSLSWSSHTDLIARARVDAEKIGRWFNEDVSARLPAEALEAVVAAFPEPWRFKLQQEIATRQQMLVWPIPNGGTSEDCNEVGLLIKDAGEAIQAISGLLDDGKIDANDRHAAPAVLIEIDDAMAALLAMRERIERQALGRKPDTASSTLRSVK